MENIKKHMYRVQQLAQQTVGIAEKSEVRSEDLQQVEQRVEVMIDVLHHMKSKLSDCFRSRVKEENFDKRRKKIDEYNLALMLFSDARQLHDAELLASVMKMYGSNLFFLADGMVRMEMGIEKQVFEGFGEFFEAEKNMLHYKEKLKRLVLDMDAAKTRHAAGQAKGEKNEHAQEELDNALVRMENCKDTFANEVFSLASKEIKMAKTIANLIQIQMEFYKSAYGSLQDCLAKVSEKIDRHPRRPLYGLSLDKHLEYSGRSIALVVEVCCAALNEIALDVEGIFRIPGNVLRVRRLKSAFDAGEVDLSEYKCDPHAIAGALKQYLRELPTPLLCDQFYKDWMEAVGCCEKNGQRLKRFKSVLHRLPANTLKNVCYLIKFLNKVAQNQYANRMNSQNLAIVFGPTLLWTVGENSVTAAPNALVNSVVEFLITNANCFFPDEIVFTSPLISSLHGCDVTGVHKNVSTVNLDESAEANEEKSSTEESVCNRSSSSLIAPSSKTATVKRTKPPAPRPPVEFVNAALTKSENGHDEAEVARRNLNCSSLSDDHRRRSVVAQSFGSDEQSENSSWVDLEIVNNKGRSPEVVAVPVPKVRLSIKRDNEHSRQTNVTVNNESKEEEQKLKINSNSLSLDRSLINKKKKKKDNGTSRMFSSSSSPSSSSSSPSSSSSSRHCILSSLDKNDECNCNAEPDVHLSPPPPPPPPPPHRPEAVSSRPPLPKKTTILSKHSFALKGTGRSSFLESTFIDCLQPTVVNSDKRSAREKMSRNNNEHCGGNSLPSLKVKLAIQEEEEEDFGGGSDDDRCCYANATVSSNGEQRSSTLCRSYTKL